MSKELWYEDRLLIDGNLVAASGGATFNNINPATEQTIGVAADASKADMDAAIGAARRAFDSTQWATDVSLRTRALRHLIDGLRSKEQQLCPTMVAEVGCTVRSTESSQTSTPLQGAQWAVDFAESYAWERDLGYSEPFGVPSLRQVCKEPVGVVAAITPWNYPLQVNLAKVLPALAAGCAVVLKPAPDTPWTASLLGQIAAETTDLPPGVFNVVTSSDHGLGQQLVEDPRVDLVTFTGSTATGSRIMTAAAASVKRMFLELGGKSACVVFDDADLDRAATFVAHNVTSHAGQGCAITSRVILPRSRFEEGLEAVVEAIRAVPYGDPTDPANVFGPLISNRQRTRVLELVAKGIHDGGKVALGGGRPRHLDVGYYVEPTVFYDVHPDAAISQEEVFGPVLVVQVHDGDDDAVNIANNSVYGLSGAVFSADVERARKCAQRMRVGTVSLNGGSWYGADMPFGGYRRSGFGRESGREGFEEYLQTKSVAALA